MKQLVGVLGHPIAHSKSPLLHNRAFQELDLPYFYTAFDVVPEQLGTAVSGLRALGIRGMNVTIPHKVAVIDHLDEVDPAACLIGAVNTIVNEADRLIGFNTDGDGYVRSLIEETGFNPMGKLVLVIGAGGAARAIVSALLFKGVSQITIINRTEERAIELIDGLKARASELSGSFAHSIQPDSLQHMQWNEIHRMMYQSDCVINTTSIGMWPEQDRMPIANPSFIQGQIVSDLVYNPLKTRWLQEASRQGAIAHGGLGMFVYQGAIAFEKWTGRPAPVRVMREAVESALRSELDIEV